MEKKTITKKYYSIKEIYTLIQSLPEIYRMSENDIRNYIKREKMEQFASLEKRRIVIEEKNVDEIIEYAERGRRKKRLYPVVK